MGVKGDFYDWEGEWKGTLAARLYKRPALAPGLEMGGVYFLGIFRSFFLLSC
jgi:hypothetical protein